ncbi:MAG: FtsW/RodA/SpoVE family cell cycle protein [Sphingomonadaceae bacterium]
MTGTRQPYIPHQKDRDRQDSRYRRNWHSRFRVWTNEVDQVVLALVLVLMAIGVAAVAVSSPASARRLSTGEVKLPDLYFYWLHIRFLCLGVIVMLAVSFLSRDNARRMGILLAAGMIFALFLVPVLGTEVNGSRRWINLGIGFQPSEFLKPAFAIVMAWILSWRMRDPKLPVMWVVTGLMLLIAVLLMLQPNLGDAILFGCVWLVLVLLAGIPFKRIGILLGVVMAGLLSAYFFYDNARHRIDSFLGGGTAYDQVDLAQRTLLGGGWTGAGIQLGVRKFSLPEAHTDYIFSVIGEEFGLLVCALLVIVYVALVARVLIRLANEEDMFTLLAGAGLVTQIGAQAFINILVNLQMFPSKGMTLPLVSYGGSSTIAVCLAIGLLLAITRRNPYLQRKAPGLKELLPVRGART